MTCITFFTFGTSEIDLATLSEFDPNTKAWTSSFIWDAAEIAFKVKGLYSPGFQNRVLDDDLNQRIFISRCRDFYESKDGTKVSMFLNYP